VVGCGAWQGECGGERLGEVLGRNNRVIEMIEARWVVAKVEWGGESLGEMLVR